MGVSFAYARNSAAAIGQYTGRQWNPKRVLVSGIALTPGTVFLEVIAMVFLFYLAAGFAWPGLTVSYCSEILPFSIRGKGLAIVFAGKASASVLHQVRVLLHCISGLSTSASAPAHQKRRAKAP